MLLSCLYTDFQIPFFLAVAVGMIFVGCLGLAMERALFRPLRDNPLGGLVASIGFLMILQSLAVMGFGVRMEHIPPVTQHVIEFSERVRLPLSRLFVIIAAVVLLSALWIFLKRTRFGWALRAAAQDPEAAALQGYFDQSDGTHRDVHRGGSGGDRGGADRAAGIGQSAYGPFGHRDGVHRDHRRRGWVSLRARLSPRSPMPFVHTFVTTFFDGVIADITGLSA